MIGYRRLPRIGHAAFAALPVAALLLSGCAGEQADSNSEGAAAQTGSAGGTTPVGTGTTIPSGADSSGAGGTATAPGASTGATAPGATTGGATTGQPGVGDPGGAGTGVTPDDSSVDDAAADDTAVVDDSAPDDSAAGADDQAGGVGADDTATDDLATDDMGMDDMGTDPVTDDVAVDDATVDDAVGTDPGTQEWWFDGPRPAPELGSWPPPALKLTEVAAGTQPTAIAAPRGDTTRLYFTEKWGVIRVIKDGVLLPEPALDMRDAVLEGGPQGSTGPEMQNQGKRGLVGLAFHPNYEENGRIFVMYTADQGIPGYGTNDHSNLYDDGDITFAEYRRSADNPDRFDPEPVSVFLQFDKGNCDQCSQHNGGSLEIDVDGFLWAGTGDPPPYDNPGSQDLNNLNGKLLRFDISGEEVVAAGNYPGADPYVASIGIRNAYKFSIDRYTGDVYVGDVGENSWEEVTVELYGDGNKDHGWPKKEGFQSFMALSCDGPACLDPVFDYGHSGAEGTPGADNCIIGGYVYRGAAIPALQGAYIYGDYGSGKIRALQIENGELLREAPHDFPGISSFMGCFGEDAAGEVYVCDYDSGRILRLDAQ